MRSAAGAARLEPGEQWRRLLARSLSGPVTSARAAVSCHEAATRQVEAAVYGFEQLAEELAVVMSLPATATAAPAELPEARETAVLRHAA